MYKLFLPLVSNFKKIIILVFPLLALNTVHASANTTVAGNISAEFAVKGGAATYSIPIAVAPGRAGMQPELSLNYSSNSADGILGMGWSLGGLSAITRCGRTFAQDGVAGGINFDSNDRYCLNGQRLIPIRGANGALGMEYRTEVDSYAKITSHGGHVNNPHFWTVRTKEGQKIIYGGNGNARWVFPQGTMSWSIRMVTDTTDKNNIVYDYLIYGNLQHLSSITYPGGKVDFSYPARASHIFSHYSHGQKFTRNKQLSKIVTRTHNNEILKEYRLTYDNKGVNKRIRLKALTLCGFDNKCTKPLTFKWNNNAAAGWETNSNFEPLGRFTSDSRAEEGTRLVDLNGDGLMDMIRGQWRPEGKAIKRAYINTGNGWRNAPEFAPPNYFSDHGGRDEGTRLVDLNGDGLMDMIRGHWRPNGTEIKHAYINTGKGWRNAPEFTPPNYFVGNKREDEGTRLVDLNGDGLMDMIRGQWRPEGKTIKRAYINTGNGWRNAPEFAPPNYFSDHEGRDEGTRLVDLNGDGLMDMIRGHWRPKGKEIKHAYINTGKGWRNAPEFTPPNYFVGDKREDEGTRLVDLNGDGLMDMIRGQWRPGGTEIKRAYINTGKGWRNAPEFTPPNYFSDYAGKDEGTRLVDLNGDGLMDMIRGHWSPNGTQIKHAYINTGAGWRRAPEFIPPNHFVNHKREDVGTRLVDVNGDGLMDIVRSQWRPGGKEIKHAYINKGSALGDVITSIVDSNGYTKTLSYKPLTNPTVYKKDKNAEFPLVDIQYPLYVISRVRSDSGLANNINTTDYTYEGLKLHAQGRGILGFRRITTSYPETGKEERTYYKFGTYPILSVPEKMEERYEGHLINSKVISYSSKKHGRFYELFTTKIVDKSYELTSSTAPVTTVITANTFDAYGNITRAQVDTVGDGKTFTKITDSVYSNEISQWYLGRLTRSIVTHRAPGQADQQHRFHYGYYGGNGLLRVEQIVSAANPSQLMSQIVHNYNQYGQKIRILKESPGLVNRAIHYTYDGQHRLATTCNVYDECSINAYDAKSRLASTTDPNGLTTRWQYDSLGRTIRENRADSTWTTTQYAFANSNICKPHNDRLIDTAYSCVVSQTKGSPKSVVQLDKLGREVRTVTKGFDGRLVYRDTQYNALGQIAGITRPYFMGEQVYWANSQYDGLDRVIQLDEPGPHGHRHIVSTTYNGLTTTVTSGADARQKITTVNALGQVIRKQEEEGTSINYTYTADGNLKTTTVAGNTNTTITLTYDQYGRKIGMDDPDMGIWSYRYDGFGQLISQTDAKGQTTTMGYDRLGRMISRIDLAGTDSATTSTWNYGDNSAPRGSRGKLLSESDGAVTKTYYYDSLGRVDEVQTIQDVGTADEMSFSTQTLYDTVGRVSRTIYPGTDNFYTENTYNAHGFLEKVRGLRSKSESYDLSTLTPLVSEAITLAASYQAQANTLKSIGQTYEAKIAKYQALWWPLQKTELLRLEIQEHLWAHQRQLTDTITTANGNAGDFYAHLNHTVIELQQVTALINKAVSNYEQLIEQLTVLSEQALAASDHRFQTQRTLTASASVYRDMVKDNTYTTYWQAIEVDATGRVRAEVYGNGVVNDYHYDTATGQLALIRSGLLTTDPIRHLEYEYDGYQNITVRQDHQNDVKETFEYDRLDRLTRTDIQSSTYTELNSTQTQSYNALGNITYKSDIGSYTYGTGIGSGSGPHALTQTAGTQNATYQYDANGNMIGGNNRTIQWSAFNKPTQITRNAQSAHFYYDGSRARYKKINHNGDTTRYVGKLYEHHTSSGQTEEKHYIYAAGTLVAEHIVSTKHGVQTRYLHKDALGTVDLITDAHANVVDRRSFDAWGKLRNWLWKDALGINAPLYLTQLPFTNKGYTGHEHIQEVDLIHMNGRVYDAGVARFLSADPFIQDPYRSQSHNRYSYVWNNPLKYTDPSGYILSGILDAISDFVSSVFGGGNQSSSSDSDDNNGSNSNVQTHQDTQQAPGDSGSTTTTSSATGLLSTIRNLLGIGDHYRIGSVVFKPSAEGSMEDVEKVANAWRNAANQRLPDGTLSVSAQMLRDIEKSDKTLTVHVGPELGYSAWPGDHPLATDGKDSIDINPSGTIDMSKDPGISGNHDVRFDLESIIVHEVQHIHDSRIGRTYHGEVGEQRATMMENEHRKAKGLTTRTIYTGPSINSFSPPTIYDIPQDFSFFDSIR